jgi:acetyl-CoA synthetase
VSEALSNLGHENRTFPPTKEFASQANAKQEIYERADKDYLAFWEEQARNLYWHKKWDQVLDWQSPFAKWFIGGKLNASYNALDRHVLEGRGDRIAFLFEGEPGDSKQITYSQLLTEVKKCANALELALPIAWSLEDFLQIHSLQEFKMLMPAW